MYKDGKIVDNGMQAKREKGDFVMKDDMPVLKFFADIRNKFDGSQERILIIVKTVIGNTAIWGQDLNEISGLAEKSADYLYKLLAMVCKLPLGA